MPTLGFIVVNGKSAMATLFMVAALKKVDLPTFGFPRIPTITSIASQRGSEGPRASPNRPRKTRRSSHRQHGAVRSQRGIRLAGRGGARSGDRTLRPDSGPSVVATGPSYG